MMQKAIRSVSIKTWRGSLWSRLSHHVLYWEGRDASDVKTEETDKSDMYE